MELTGLCKICGQPGKMYTCSHCGSLVCRKCFIFSKRICIACAEGYRF